MYNEIISKIASVGEGKVKLLNESKAKYLILSIMAGMFVGFGIILIFTIGGVLGDNPMKKVVMGVSFGIALSLVLLIGSELFTGNNFIMMISSLEKKVTWASSIKIWIYSYIGNLLGSVLVGWLFFSTGLVKGGVADFIVKVSASKMNAPFMELFFRGILCNILVCLAVFAFIKLQNEVAKLIMIFWCLFAFITSGFEHSIANMTLFTIGLFAPHGANVSLSGFAANLIPVTLGNFVGGALILGLGYWYVGRSKS